jgi:excisionase family DNA binding protein
LRHYAARGVGMTEPLITADEVAAITGMSRDWIYAETRAGRIPHVPLGRYVRYRRSSIDEWISRLEAATMRPDNRKVGRRGGNRPARGMEGDISHAGQP